MKRLIIFLLGVLFVAVSFAADKYIKAGIGYSYYTGTAADTINGVTTVDVVFAVENIGHYTIGLYAEGDTLTGCDGNVTIQVSGSYDESGTYTNIGSAITWTTTADYSASTMYNTYTLVNASHTETHSGNIVTAASVNPHYGTSDFGADSITVWLDTTSIAAQTQTRADINTVAAQTTTVTMPGCDYRFIKVLFTGASSAIVEIDKVGLKVNPIDIPKR